jgi:hypothetical protein
VTRSCVERRYRVIPSLSKGRNYIEPSFDKLRMTQGMRHTVGLGFPDHEVGHAVVEVFNVGEDGSAIVG